MKPQQGSELVQASEHLYGPHDDDDDDDGNAESRPPAHPVVEKQRSFVRRAFSLPSYLWHPHAKAEGVRMYHTNKNDHHAVNHPNEKIATKHHPDTKKNDFVQEVFHDVHELHKYEDVVYFPVRSNHLVLMDDTLGSVIFSHCNVCSGPPDYWIYLCQRCTWTFKALAWIDKSILSVAR